MHHDEPLLRAYRISAYTVDIQEYLIQLREWKERFVDEDDEYKLWALGSHLGEIIHLLEMEFGE